MPPFSTDDYYKLLQKIAVLETKILRLEVNMEEGLFNPSTKEKTKSKSKPTKDTGILLENRFAPLLQDPDSPKERSSSSTGERYEAKSYTKRLQKELTTGPQTLIVGDGAVNKTKHFFSKNTKVLCFTNDMVSDISEKILEITAEHPTVKSLVIHTGALDVVKQQSEVLKRDFNDLLNKV
ncbi:hypothetical protein N1851_007105 [Merluccius polli]|uniref:Uncharacterized protein n=1 Tax=Merluccius polli TaxID=89951 RepID=A0AA47N4R9_MERPO|nr:hypothetical protein N1851_007105 [Merluccius polli]